MYASELCTKALKAINAIGQADVALPYDLSVAFETLNDMIDGWAAIRLTIFQNLRYVYNLTTGKGGPTNPYTIGTGADFDQVRPLWIPDATVLVTSATNPYEIPLEVLGESDYAPISIKTLASGLPTALYYNERFPTSGASAGWGQIFLYPVPNGQQTLQLVLYTPVPLTEFADLNTTDYSFPPGYREAMKWQLALRLCAPFGKPVPPVVASMALETFSIIQKPNVHIPALQSDFLGMGRTTGLYDWRTGSSSRRGIY